MYSDLEKEIKEESLVEKEDLKNALSYKIIGAFLNDSHVDRNVIRSEIVGVLPHIDQVMLDVRLDKFIEQIEEDFEGMNIMKEEIKKDPQLMLKKIDDNLDFLIPDSE